MLFLSLEERAWLIQLKNLNCERKDLIIEFPLDSDMDLDQLIIDIPQQTYECFIYKVPPALRKVNHDAYTPMLISIGPFHHKDEKLNVNVYYVMGFRPFRPNYFTCTAHLYLYCILLVPHTYASYIRHWCIFSHQEIQYNLPVFLHSNANFNWPISSHRQKVEEHGRTETEIFLRNYQIHMVDKWCGLSFY